MSNDRVPTSGLAPLVVGRAREFEGRVFLEEVATGRTLTFSHLGELTRRRAAELTAAHVPAQARVMIDVADPVNFCIEYLGVVAAGRCAVPVNPDAPDAELARTVATVEPAVLITDRPGRASALVLPALETPPRPLPPGRGGTTTLKRFGTPDHFGTLNRPGVSGGSVLLLTSGSTGAPKAVELTEQQLVYVAGGVARHNELTPADRGYSALPLFHINAQVVALLASLVAGSTLLVDRRFRRTGFWERLAQRDVTWINAVPAILTILAEYPVLARPARLRFIRSASAPLPAAVRQRVEAQAGVPVVESYGMTEAASQITAMPLDGSGPAGSCGQAVGVALQVRNGDGVAVPAGTIGTVWLRGPGVISAYVAARGGRPGTGTVAAERFGADGWLSSGDLGYRDEGGFLFLAGRSDDVINRGGEMLYPREIEEVLMADPAVRDAVVVGRSNTILGQVPVAYVIPAQEPDTASHLEELLARLNGRCAAELSRFKLPEAIYVVPDLPRAATGKVQRHRLRQDPVQTAVGQRAA
ncbi:MAG TPA: AMP-binding protein [Streptosporangiaceae bacterium]